jgi:hypothetical protein
VEAGPIRQSERQTRWNATSILDHVTTSRHDPRAAEYGGTVTLRARSQGIDFTYAYPFSNRTSVLDAIDGATKSLLSELDSLSRACMDVTRQERDAINEGGRSGGRSIRRTSPRMSQRRGSNSAGFGSSTEASDGRSCAAAAWATIPASACLNRVGASSVYRTVCRIDRCPIQARISQVS